MHRYKHKHRRGAIYDINKGGDRNKTKKDETTLACDIGVESYDLMRRLN